MQLPQPGSFYFPDSEIQAEVLAYLPSQKGTEIWAGAAPASEIQTTALRWCQGSQLRRCQRYFPGTFF